MTEAGGITKVEDQPTGKTKYLPDFVKMAEAHGALGIRVTEKGQVTGALERALKEVKTRSVILDVYISPDEKVFPMVPAGKGLDDIIVDMA
jgi:acetolactate synthase-1/2/3 large subunit